MEVIARSQLCLVHSAFPIPDIFVIIGVILLLSVIYNKQTTFSRADHFFPIPMLDPLYVFCSTHIFHTLLFFFPSSHTYIYCSFFTTPPFALNHCIKAMFFILHIFRFLTKYLILSDLLCAICERPYNFSMSAGNNPNRNQGAGNVNDDMYYNRMYNQWTMMRESPLENCWAEPRDNGDQTDLFTWDAIIFGPADSPFEGGTFRLIAKFDRTRSVGYPPKIFFTTPMFHPNIDKNGQIGLDILRTEYSPALTIPKLLLSICSLLTDPNPHNAHNLKAAELYLNDRAKYDETVREWTAKYAADMKDPREAEREWEERRAMETSEMRENDRLARAALEAEDIEKQLQQMPSAAPSTSSSSAAEQADLALALALAEEEEEDEAVESRPFRPRR